MLEIYEENYLKLSIPESPVQVLIIKSGWSDFYHVITEDPQEGDLYYNHEFLREEKIKLRYGVEL